MKSCLLFIFMLTFAIPVVADDISAIKAAADKRYSVTTQTQTGRDIVQWYKLNSSNTVSFREAFEFLKSHQNWPGTKTIQKNAENAISSSNPSGEIINYFNQFPPITADGMAHYLNALIVSGKTAQAIQVLKNWWPKASITPNDQDMIIRLFGQYLGSQDYERRIKTIIHDKHYTASRALADKLGKGYPQLVEAKIALLENKPDVNELVARVPANLMNNEALMLARAQWRRKNDYNEGAIELLNMAPTYNNMSNPDDWWKERHIMARRLMEEGKWGSAYKLVSDHRQENGFPLAQAEFVAGWIALRKVGKPWEAFKHFEKLFNNVESPISRSRGAYWAGLASDTLGHAEIAMQWYRVAAKYQTTYYGQMAARKINLPLALLNETPIQLTSQSRASFRQNSLISAAILLNRAEQNRDAQQFLKAFGDQSKNGMDYSMAAELAKSLGYNNSALAIAKSAERDGFLMPSYLFPVLAEAKSKPYAVPPAFNHGIMRQESAFDQYAQSHAGALGLMQLMPATAKETAGKAGLPYSKSRLTSDPSYNMTLGSLYIKQMLDRYDGNRTLAIAAYNAGPGRVSGWLKEFGDPRNPNIDEVDWIEVIPIYETRNYVQRVTEAVNVYSRLIQ